MEGNDPCCWLPFLLQAGMLKGERWVPPDLEVGHLPHMMGHPYGGLFLFSQSARMMRPVRYWAGGGGLELIGTLEQVGTCLCVAYSQSRISCDASAVDYIYNLSHKQHPDWQDSAAAVMV